MFGSTFLSIFLLCIAPVFGIFKSVLLTYMLQKILKKKRSWHSQLYFPPRYPLHASCRLQWSFSTLSCPQVANLNLSKTLFKKKILWFNISGQFKKKFSGAAAAWEANAGMGGRLQLWNHVKLLSRAALWPGDHKDSLKHFFTALTCIHRGICCQYDTHHELC